ncbi:MAG: ABC transporter permease [Clostridia bacterium]|nr:ABC transporter permease [Clostridia bacterium]
MRKRWAFILCAPGIAFIVLCCTYPVLRVVLQTFYDETGTVSFAGYLNLFSLSFFRNSLLRTLKLSVITTAICAAVGIPVSFYISRMSEQRKGLAISLATFPLLTSAIVRSICWIVLLGKKGTINNLLISLGIIQKPLSILYTETSMLIGYIQLFLPLMLLSLIGVMESIDDELILAARTLGCNAILSFLKVVIPLSVSGLITGSMLVFTGTMTAYATPTLLGGTKTKVLSTMLDQYANSMYDWPSAAMVAAVMIVLTVSVNVIFSRVAGKLNRGART